MISRTLLALALAVSLDACSVASTPVSPIPVGPVELANRTALDEEARNGIELGYKAFRLALELAVDTGVLKGQRAATAAAADIRAYRALLVMREAYKTANQSDWLAAARSANIAVEQAIATARNLPPRH